MSLINEQRQVFMVYAYTTVTLNCMTMWVGQPTYVITAEFFPQRLKSPLHEMMGKKSDDHKSSDKVIVNNPGQRTCAKGL